MKRDGLLDLNDALQHPGRVIGVDLSTELPDEQDLDLVQPIEGWLEAISTGNQLLITGEFKCRCVAECARCSAAIEQDIEFRLEEAFAVDGTASMYSSDDFARVVDDEGGNLFHENSLQVENLLRQGLWLNFPVQPLCEFGWDGPCPKAKEIIENRKKAEDAGKLGDLAQFLESND